MKKPKLLLDENIGLVTADLLRQDGFDTLSILEDFPGAKDSEVLARAVKSKRLLVTSDKDFGQLVYANSSKHAGIILLRLHDESPENIYEILGSVLVRPVSELKNKFIVVSENKIRIR